MSVQTAIIIFISLTLLMSGESWSQRVHVEGPPASLSTFEKKATKELRHNPVQHNRFVSVISSKKTNDLTAAGKIFAFTNAHTSKQFLLPGVDQKMTDYLNDDLSHRLFYKPITSVVNPSFLISF